jgi:hypothetical protein
MSAIWKCPLVILIVVKLESVLKLEPKYLSTIAIDLVVLPNDGPMIYGGVKRSEG